MFSFALAIICLPPISLQSPNHLATPPASQSWRIRKGFIVDSQGKRVGNFVVDSVRPGLVR